jgi:hypothetical protein
MYAHMYICNASIGLKSADAIWFGKPRLAWKNKRAISMDHVKGAMYVNFTRGIRNLQRAAWIELENQENKSKYFFYAVSGELVNQTIFIS